MAHRREQIHALAEWLDRAIEAGEEPAGPARAAFRHAAAALQESAAPHGDRTAQDAPPRPLPVLRYWPGAIAAAQRGAGAAAAAALDALFADLRWMQNPNYRARPPAPDFLANYGYAQIAGAPTVPTLLATEACSVGLLLLGPHLLYPPHRHPAEELYLPLSAAEWRRGTEPWRAVPPGRPIHHRSGMSHAVRAGADPLLALYVWLGDLTTHARIEGA